MYQERKLALCKESAMEKGKLQLLEDSVKVAIINYIEAIHAEYKCSEEQDQYLQNLKTFLDPKGDTACAMESVMNLEVHQLFVRVLLEYVFLRDMSFDSFWFEYEFFEDIPVSLRYKERIQNIIVATYNEFGVEAIVNRFTNAEEEQYRCCLEEAIEAIRGLVLTEERLNEFYRINMDSISYFIKGHISLDRDRDPFLTQEEIFETIMTLSGGKHSIKEVVAYRID